MFKPIWSIAANTFREIIRDRILYGIGVFALLLMGVSVALGSLSFAEQSRIAANFAITGVHLSVAVLSIFVGSTLVTKELEKKTIMTLLARPISRWQFLLGKALGLTMINVVVVFALSLVSLLVFVGLGVDPSARFLVSLDGVLLEGVVLMGLALFFSGFATPIVVSSCCVGLYLVGHWLDSLSYFFDKQSGELIYYVTTGMTYVLPNLERFNWRTLAIYPDPIPWKSVYASTFYGLTWFFFLVFATYLVIRRKDLG